MNDNLTISMTSRKRPTETTSTRNAVESSIDLCKLDHTCTWEALLRHNETITPWHEYRQPRDDQGKTPR